MDFKKKAEKVQSSTRRHLLRHNGEYCDVFCREEETQHIEQDLKEIADAVREETIRACADLIKEPCPYYPKPCGDCRHCHLTKAASRILGLLKPNPSEPIENTDKERK